jgi:hypothetical protein
MFAAAPIKGPARKRLRGCSRVTLFGLGKFEKRPKQIQRQWKHGSGVVLGGHFPHGL